MTADSNDADAEGWCEGDGTVEDGTSDGRRRDLDTPAGWVPRAWGPTVSRRALLNTVGMLPFVGSALDAGADTGAAGPGGGRLVGAGPTTLDVGTDGGTGAAVALDDTTAVVGVPSGITPDGPDAGSAVVFSRSSSTWSRQARLTAAGDGGQFGRVVGLDGDTAIVGAPLGTGATGGLGGRVFVFTRDGGAWTRQATLAADSPGGVDQFGTAVAVSGDTAVVGASAASTERGSTTGAASVYTRSGETWTRRATLVPPDDDVDRFGTAVALDGETVVVGARRHDGPGSSVRGTVYVFGRSGRRWTVQARLGGEGTDGPDGFGTALALDGATAVVGAPTETNAAGTNAGAAYVFARSAGRWRRTATLGAREPAPDDRFGTAVGLDGDVALVGTEFGADPAVFVRSAGRWTHRSLLGHAGAASPARTGAVVALDGRRALVGAEGVGDPADPADGTVEVFER